jgi:hypothetical protein
MTASQKHDLADLLCEHQEVFSKAEHDLSTFTSVKHRIDTSEAKPILQKPGRLLLTSRARRGDIFKTK